MIRWLSYWWESREEGALGRLSVASLKYWARHERW